MFYITIVLYINYLIICEHSLTLFFRKFNEKITSTDWIHRYEGNFMIFKYFWHTYLPKLSKLKWRLKNFQNTTWKSVQFSALLTFLSFNLWQLSVIFLILRIHIFLIVKNRISCKDLTSKWKFLVYFCGWEMFSKGRSTFRNLSDSQRENHDHVRNQPGT